MRWKILLFFARARGWIHSGIIFVSLCTKRKCAGKQSAAIAHFIRASILHTARGRGRMQKYLSRFSTSHQCRGSVIATNTVIFGGEIDTEIETHFHKIFLHTSSIGDALTTSNAGSAIGGLARLRFTAFRVLPPAWMGSSRISNFAQLHPRWRNINSAATLLSARHSHLRLWKIGKNGAEVSLVKS